jgi:hypothetical protein
MKFSGRTNVHAISKPTSVDGSRGSLPPLLLTHFVDVMRRWRRGMAAFGWEQTLAHQLVLYALWHLVLSYG